MRVIPMSVRPRPRFAWSAARSLGAVPAPVFALIYLGVLLAFAVVYHMFVPRGFYHPTAHLEPSLQAEATAILREIRAEMVGAIADGTDSARVELGSWRLDTSSITLSTLQPDSLGFSFRLGAFAKKPIPRGEAVGVIDAYVRVSLEAISDRFRQLGRREWLYLPIEEVSLDSAFRQDLTEGAVARRLFPERRSDSSWSLDESTGTLKVDMDLAGFLRCTHALRRRLAALVEGMRGFPSRVPGAFCRMLYVSASVMTSTTFGDVVPVTTAARGLVTLQAVLSVIIVGLFINSIAHYIRRTD